MTARGAAREWRYLRVAMVALAVVVLVDVGAWKVRDLGTDAPTRLELSLNCLHGEKGARTVVPAGDPLADSAGDGSLKTTIEGNGVTVALASSEEQAIKIERYYHALADGLEGRLERRGRTVYLWRFRSSPTQRQAMYDCQY
jgi:hypothetical protein